MTLSSWLSKFDQMSLMTNLNFSPDFLMNRIFIIKVPYLLLNTWSLSIYLLFPRQIKETGYAWILFVSSFRRVETCAPDPLRYQSGLFSWEIALSLWDFLPIYRQILRPTFSFQSRHELSFSALTLCWMLRRLLLVL